MDNSDRSTTQVQDQLSTLFLSSSSSSPSPSTTSEMSNTHVLTKNITKVDLDENVTQCRQTDSLNKALHAFQLSDGFALTKLHEFNLTIPSANEKPDKKFRLERKSFAIACRSNLTKDAILQHIQKEFNELLEYVCISCVDQPEMCQPPWIYYIQIHLQKSVNMHRLFFREVAGMECNYRVTNNDKDWNHFLKNVGTYVEVGRFRSVRSLPKHINVNMSNYQLLQSGFFPRTKSYRRRFRTTKPHIPISSFTTDSTLNDYIRYMNELSTLPSVSVTTAMGDYDTNHTTFMLTSTLSSSTYEFTTQNSTHSHDLGIGTMAYPSLSHYITKILHSILSFIVQQRGNLWQYALYSASFCFFLLMMQMLIRHLRACHRTYFSRKKHPPQLRIHSSTSEYCITPTYAGFPTNDDDIQHYDNSNPCSLASNQITLAGSVITFLPDKV
ncbi:unnamed protein product [Adineta ricciae]|uniref:Uncharacterized protein n=1 Tax=Adineta ricciae TaxID=249248 RepID=A0A814IXR3_ADIRI|nr:unnamed protein product [Adineta ricciae]